MSRLVKLDSSIDRRGVLLDILFSINYNDTEKLKYTFSTADPRECAFALSFITEEQLRKVVNILQGEIRQEIIDALEEDSRLNLVEKINEIHTEESEPINLVDRDTLIQKALIIVADAISKRDTMRISKIFESMQSSDAATIIEFLKPRQRYAILELLGNNFDSEILTYLDPSISGNLLNKIDQKVLSIYISQMKKQDMIEILEQMSLRQRAATINSISQLIPKEDLRFVKKSLEYKEGTAGRIMNNVIVMPATSSIHTAYKRYCFYSKVSDANQVIYIYDNNSHMKIPGKIYLSDLCKLNQRRQSRLEPLSKHLRPVPFVVFVDTNISEIAFLVKKYYTIDMPVLTSNNKIVGSISSEQVINVFEVIEDKNMMTLGGVSDFDFHAGIVTTVRRRLGTLTIATILCVGSASLIFAFEETVKILFPLVFISPIIAGVGGNTGSQVMTVTVRALFSGEIVGANKVRAILKEIAVCLLCGIFIGIVMFVLTFMHWKSWLFSLIVFGSISLNLAIAGFVGAGIPILLSAFKKDPAFSSTFMNVATDLCSYTIFFGTAWLFRSQLKQQLPEEPEIVHHDIK